MNEQALLLVGEAIDHLINTDASGRGIISKIYSYAREKIEKPLALTAAEGLTDRVKENGTVFLSSGWINRPWVTNYLAESDGPPGIASLARALNKEFRAAPIVLVEEYIVDRMEKVLQAAGFITLTPDQCIKALEGTSKKGGLLNAASVIAFPIDPEEAKKEAKSLIEKYEPSAVIVSEKGGINEVGIVHNSRGQSTTDTMAKIDYLVLHAKEKDILTIGIGDGGNEIGMGVIRERLKELLPMARKCICPCGKGIAPATETDCLVTAAVSNWGAYAIEACLAILKQDIEILHTPSLEDRILTRTADAQWVDGISGICEPSVDGMVAEVHKAVIVILTQIVKRGMREIYGESMFAR
jgi:hypothetical protein